MSADVVEMPAHVNAAPEDDDGRVLHDLLTDIAHRLDRIETQLSIDSTHLTELKDTPRRLVQLEILTSNTLRDLAIHETKRGHDGLAELTTRTEKSVDSLGERVRVLERDIISEQAAARRSQAIWLGSLTVINILIVLASFVLRLLHLE